MLQSINPMNLVFFFSDPESTIIFEQQNERNITMNFYAFLIKLRGSETTLQMSINTQLEVL